MHGPVMRMIHLCTAHPSLLPVDSMIMADKLIQHIAHQYATTNNCQTVWRRRLVLHLQWLTSGGWRLCETSHQNVSRHSACERRILWTERQTYQAVNDLNFGVLNFAFSASQICMRLDALYKMPTMLERIPPVSCSAKLIRYKL